MGTKKTSSSSEKKLEATIKKLTAELKRVDAKATRWQKKAKRHQAAFAASQKRVTKLEKKLAEARRTPSRPSANGDELPSPTERSCNGALGRRRSACVHARHELDGRPAARGGTRAGTGRPVVEAEGRDPRRSDRRGGTGGEHGFRRALGLSGPTTTPAVRSVSGRLP